MEVPPTYVANGWTRRFSFIAMVVSLTTLVMMGVHERKTTSFRKTVRTTMDEVHDLQVLSGQLQVIEERLRRVEDAIGIGEFSP